MIDALRFFLALPEPSIAAALARRRGTGEPCLSRFLPLSLSFSLSFSFSRSFSLACISATRCFWRRTARSRSTGRGSQSQQRHSSGTSPSTISKHAAWHQREQTSQAMLKPSSKRKPQMQLIASVSGAGGLLGCTGCKVVVVEAVVGVGDSFPGDKGRTENDGIWFRF